MSEVYAGFTDIHAHFLYGLDDGAEDRGGWKRCWTRHMRTGSRPCLQRRTSRPELSPLIWRAIKSIWRKRGAYCRRKGYALRLYSGAEILYTPALEQYALNHRLPTLAGSDYVLIEFMPDISYRELELAAAHLERGGYIPVLAHVERYPCLYSRKHAAALKERRNVRYQVNANTVLSSGGFFHRRILQGWFRCGLVDFVASDAHDCNRRPFRMRKAYDVLERLYGQDEAMRLTGLE